MMTTKPPSVEPCTTALAPAAAVKVGGRSLSHERPAKATLATTTALTGDGDEKRRHRTGAAGTPQPKSSTSRSAPTIRSRAAAVRNPYKGNRGLTRAWHAMKNSLAGFRVAIREESAFRQELTLAAIAAVRRAGFRLSPVSRVLLLGSVLLVLIVELLNSSVKRPSTVSRSSGTSSSRAREGPGQRRGDGRARHVRDDVGG